MMKPGLSLIGILAGALIASSALADAGDDAAADAGDDAAAGAGGTAGSDAGAAGSGGTVADASTDGSGGFAGSLTCGNKTCDGWTIGGLVTIPPCCTGPQDQKCGALITSQVAAYGVPEGCHEIDQPGNTACACPDMQTPLMDLPGCCRNASSTCGVFADLSGLGGPNMGCVDPSLVTEGGTPVQCTPGPDETCGGTGGSGGASGGSAGASGAAATAGSSGSAGTAAGGSAGSAGGGDEDDDGGCGCRAPGGDSSTSAWLAALALLGALGLRRRRSR
jgi:MYXO-CTERM domain-containing protein